MHISKGKCSYQLQMGMLKLDTCEPVCVQLHCCRTKEWKVSTKKGTQMLKINYLSCLSSLLWQKYWGFWSQLALLSGTDPKDPEKKQVLHLPFRMQICSVDSFSRANARTHSDICSYFYQTSTYVAAAETCPLLVRWAPKCICMHLSRQQRSRWKQNHIQGDTCAWANPLVRAKGGAKWTEKVLPPQNFLIALQSGGEISPSFSEQSLRYCALCGAQ